MAITNTNQLVTKNYDTNFENIFGPIPKNATGTYMYDGTLKKMIKVKKNPNIIFNKLDSKVESVREISPVEIRKKHHVD